MGNSSYVQAAKGVMLLGEQWAISAARLSLASRGIQTIIAGVFFSARLCNPSETHRRHGRTRPAQTLNLLGVVFVVRCLQWRYRQNRRRHVAKRLVATASSSRVRNSGRGVVCSQIHPSRAASPRAGDKGLRLVRWRWGVRRLEFRAGQGGPKR